MPTDNPRVRKEPTPVAEPLRRVLFFGKSMSRTCVTRGLVEALTYHGLRVKWLNMATLRRWMGARLAAEHARSAHREFCPDLVFVFCRDLPFSLLDEFARDSRTALWFDGPLQDRSVPIAKYIGRADMAFMTSPSEFDWLREHGVTQTAFVMEGFSSSFHYPARVRSAQRDVVFIGGPGRRGQRAGFLARVAQCCDLEIFGAGWEPYRRRYPSLRIFRPVGPRGYRGLCATSRIVLGINEVNDHALYFSNRTLLTLACRGFHLTHYVPHLERVFKDGAHLAWFEDLDDCLAKIHYYLERPEERARISDLGCAYVHSEHQYTSRIAFVLKSLREGLPASIERLARGPRPVVPLDLESRRLRG